MMRPLADAQWDQPASSLYAGLLFLVFGRLVCADRISNCPLDRVLTYETLIGLAFATLPPPCVERISALTLSEENHTS